MEATVQRAVDAGRHLDPIPESFSIALKLAANRGDVNLVVALDGINPNVGFSLIFAAEKGHSTVVELLLTVKNINPNIGEQWGDGAPLLRACRGGMHPL